jgi:hypothetical protein
MSGAIESLGRIGEKNSKNKKKINKKSTKKKNKKNVNISPSVHFQ